MTEIADERARARRGHAGVRAEKVPFSRTVFEVERRGAGRVFSEGAAVTRLRAERGGEGVRFSVPSRDRAKVVAICSSLCYNYKIINDKGLLLSLLRAAGRAGVLLGAAAAVALAAVHPMFVFGVEYSGDDMPVVREVLSEHGVREGAFLPGLDCEALERELMTLDGVAFADVDKRGTRVYVDVHAERPDGDFEVIPTGDVTASKTASVTRVIVRSGTAEAAYGDIVRAGDVLIGAYTLSGDERVPCPADGEVFGLVSRTSTRFFPDTVLVKEFGRVKRVSRIVFGSGVPEAPESPFEHCVIETETTVNGLLIGYTLYTYTFREVKVREEPNSLSREEMERTAAADALSELPPSAERVSVSVKSAKTAGGTTVTVTVQSEERID